MPRKSSKQCVATVSYYISIFTVSRSPLPTMESLARALNASPIVCALYHLIKIKFPFISFSNIYVFIKFTKVCPCNANISLNFKFIYSKFPSTPLTRHLYRRAEVRSYVQTRRQNLRLLDITFKWPRAKFFRAVICKICWSYAKNNSDLFGISPHNLNERNRFSIVFRIIF